MTDKIYTSFQEWRKDHVIQTTAGEALAEICWNAAVKSCDHRDQLRTLKLEEQLILIRSLINNLLAK